MHKIDYCKGCKAPIIWIRTVRGRNMPCEAKKVIFMTGKGHLHHGYEVHWGNCPERGKFKDSNWASEAKEK